MARQTYEDWIPVETGSDVLQAIKQNSAVDLLARSETMASDTKQVPRIGDFDVSGVAKGGTYTETTTTNDYVELIARKVGGAKRVADEDLMDTITAERTLTLEQTAAASSLAKFFDNACLGTSAAMNGTTVLYTSVYKALRTTNSATGYTADANYQAFSLANDLDSSGYVKVSNMLKQVEDSEWFDPANAFVIASPAWKAVFRTVVDGQGRPYWIDPRQGGNGDLFGYGAPTWSMGARTSPVNTRSPQGNPLIIVGDRRLLIKGMAKLSPRIVDGNPGYAIQPGRTGIGFLTDETLLKVAMRRGFAVGHEKGMAIMELTA